jgi:HD-GYP domain-containing protein (c-di-GMP phosphodiesterase class II)/CheY-like chemotaxis protein
MTDIQDELLRTGADTRPVPAVHHWKVLIVDSEDAAREATEADLAGARPFGHDLRCLHARGLESALRTLQHHPDTAVVIVSEALERGRSAMDVVRHIRGELGNSLVRILLWAGQRPAIATLPASEDVEDFRDEPEFRGRRRIRAVRNALAHYRKLRELQQGSLALRGVLDATVRIFAAQTQPAFAEGVLQELAELLSGTGTAPACMAGFLATRGSDERLQLVAGLGPYASLAGRCATQAVDPAARSVLERAARERAHQYGPDHFAAFLPARNGEDTVLYLSSAVPLAATDAGLVELFCRNVAVALENRRLHLERDRAQGDMVLALSEAIEVRSRETGNHVRRVAEYARLLADLYGLDEETSQLLYLAAPLHDAGKIAIPDAILNKPGAHTAQEAAIMRSHAEVGRQLFAAHDSPILKAAAIVAGEHHEHWDGRGYPHGYRGEQIHIFGRIIALADVFDALSHKRCYKEAWSVQQTLQYLADERGRRFDPDLVDLFMQNLEGFLAIRDRYGDAPPRSDLVH